MRVPNYSHYSEPAAPWMGRTPSHWAASTLGRVTVDKCDGPFGSGIKSEHYTDVGALVVRLQNIRAGRFHRGDPVFVDQDYFDSELRRHEVLPGDVLVAGLGDDNNLLGRACVAPDKLGSALVKADCFRFRVDRRKVLPSFLAMQLSAGAKFDAGTLSSGTTRSRIPLSTMATRRLALPPLEEQAAIIAFLESETRRIDELSEAQEKLLALLAEKRQATIANAVNRGLNPSAPLKDSGVSWLGEVPAHWSVGKIQSFARRETGHTPSRQHPEYWENCRIPWFSLADVWQIRDGKLKYVHNTKEMVSELGIANSSARLLPAGTVMLSRTASVGYSAIMGRAMATTQDFINWVCGPLLKPEFLLYVLRGMRPEFDRLMMGSTHQTIYMPDVAKLMMTMPPLHEQADIIAFLDQSTAKLDALRDEAERAIGLLKERRSALIAAAVTGQIDVRGAELQSVLQEEPAS